MKVVFYKNKKGEEPARDFLDSLDKKMRAKMTRTQYRDDFLNHIK